MSTVRCHMVCGRCFLIIKFRLPPGAALVQHHFPSWNFSDWREAYYLSCLFHDIGTADSYLPQSEEEIDKKSKLSFEFKGGIVARDFILQHGGAEDLADAVCEV